MGSMQEMIAQAERDLLHTYNRYQVVLDRGEGCFLYDTDGKKYLDMMSGIGVFALGYGNQEFNDALKAQIDKVIHTSNYFYNEPAIRAAHRMKEVSGMDRVFFTNSGAEAIEGALKAAVKYAWLKDGAGDHEIIAMDHSFHGRTYGALAVTGKESYRAPFGTMPANARFAKINDLASVEAVLSDRTCAIIVETVQGEGGIYPAEESFLRALRKICDERDILLIFDEVQCGMGRTGYMFAWQKYGIRPDILTTAKALGCGIPVGAFLLTEHVAQHSLTAGDHGTTYGGNPLATAAINAVLDIYEREQIPARAAETGAYLYDRLEELAADYPEIIDHRGRGLMQGLEFEGPVGGIIARAMDRGVIFINAGPNVIRFLPPLTISKDEIDEALRLLRESIRE